MADKKMKSPRGLTPRLSNLNPIEYSYTDGQVSDDAYMGSKPVPMEALIELEGLYKRYPELAQIPVNQSTWLTGSPVTAMEDGGLVLQPGLSDEEVSKILNEYMAYRVRMKAGRADYGTGTRGNL